MADNTRNATIAGILFKLDDPYAEGHSCTAQEAKALNQTRAENICNNFRDKVKKAAEEAGGTLPEAKIAEFQEEISQYASTYIFSAAGGGRVTDPVEREAKAMATQALDAIIRAKGMTPSAYKKENKEKYDQNIATLMQKEEIIKGAQKIVKDKEKLTAGLEV